MVRKYKYGINLIEVLITSVITGFVLLSTVDMLSSGFLAQGAVSSDITSKYSNVSLNDRIVSRIREASSVYYDTMYISIPIGTLSTVIIPENDGIAVLVPKFGTNGNVIQPSVNVTSFTGVAFSVVPKSFISSNSQDSDKYALIETTIDFDLATTESDPIKITGSLPTDWSSGKTYMLADNLRPASMTNMNDVMFDVEGDMVNFAFVPSNGVVYFPSDIGTEQIDDSLNLTSCKFRNFRIN